MPVVTLKGGPGSGHFNHAGRPGKIGGSSPKNYSFKPGEAPYFNFSKDSNVVDIVANIILKPYMQQISISEETLSKIKDDICNTISNESNSDYDNVNNIIAQWARTSNAEYGSSLIQKEVSEEFGIELSDWQKYNLHKTEEVIKDSLDRYEFYYKQYFKEIKEDWGNNKIRIFNELKILLNDYEYTSKIFSNDKIQDLVDAIYSNDESNMTKYANEIAAARVESYYPSKFNDIKQVYKAMYSNTQSHIKSAISDYISKGNDFDGYITLYRGIVSDKFKSLKLNDIIDYSGNSMESWSASPRVAKSFASSGIVISMRVPIENIVSTCLTGIGCLIESEFVIFDNIPGSKVKVVKPVGEY